MKIYYHMVEIPNYKEEFLVNYKQTREKFFKYLREHVSPKFHDLLFNAIEKHNKKQPVNIKKLKHDLRDEIRKKDRNFLFNLNNKMS